MFTSLLFSSLLHAQEATPDNRGFEIPGATVNKEVHFTSPGYVERPLRPTTHPKDPVLSDGVIENFQRLYINERNLKISPNKGTETDAKLSLPIVNRTTAWVDIEISGQKIGRIGPLTTGVIHNVVGGEYDVTYTVEHMQYAYVERVKTHKFSNAVTPGNVQAEIANIPGYKKPFFDDAPNTKGGKLVEFGFPTAKTPTEAPSEAPTEK